MVTDNEGMLEGKSSDVVETPSHSNPIYQSPGSVSSKYIRFQEEQLKELSEEES
jgi:galactose-1-phosphate uridylyltransferase